jgi:hypothetical protein
VLLAVKVHKAEQVLQDLLLVLRLLQQFQELELMVMEVVAEVVLVQVANF